MTGTGRRRWLIGVGVLVAVAVVLTGWAVRRDGDGDSGSDTTPTGELTWVQRLAELVGVDGVNRISPFANGIALGDVAARLSTPQDLDTFSARYGIGPLDMASQLGLTMASIANDVASSSACGVRAQEMRSADTAFMLVLSSEAVARIDGDQDRAAAIAQILPAAIQGDQRETIAAQLANGDIDAAAPSVERELGDDAAVLLMRALVEELTGILANESDADYLTSFLGSYDFAANVQFSGADCD